MRGPRGSGHLLGAKASLRPAPLRRDPRIAALLQLVLLVRPVSRSRLKVAASFTAPAGALLVRPAWMGLHWTELRPAMRAMSRSRCQVV